MTSSADQFIEWFDTQTTAEDRASPMFSIRIVAWLRDRWPHARGELIHGQSGKTFLRFSFPDGSGVLLDPSVIDPRPELIQ